MNSNRTSARCPNCSARSSKAHSRYTRLVQDLPIGERPVNLLIVSRKWFCQQADCPAKIFTERYEGIPAKGRRTMRTEHVLSKLAFSTSYLAAEKVARALHIPVSHDTLLSIIQKTELNPEVSPFLGY